jgi:hypothetical protein
MGLFPFSGPSAFCRSPGLFYLRPAFQSGREKSLTTVTDNNHLQSRDAEAVSSNFKTQRQHILDLLMAAEGGEVPLAEIMVCAAQYNVCIHQLRKRGYKIVNRTEKRNGVLYSWYRLESSPSEVTPHEPPPSPAPARSRKKSTPSEPAPPGTQANLPPQLSPSPSVPQTLSLFPDLPQTPAPATAPQHSVWRDPELGGVKN